MSRSFQRGVFRGKQETATLVSVVSGKKFVVAQGGILQPKPKLPTNIDVDVASLACSGAEPAVAQGVNGQSPVAGLLVASPEPVVAQGVSVSPAAGELLLDDLAAAVAQGVSVSPAAGELLLDDLAAAMAQGVSVSPAAGELLLIGLEPVVSLGGGIVAPDGSLVLGAEAPLPGTGVVAPAALGSLLAGAEAPQVALGVGIFADLARLVLEDLEASPVSGISVGADGSLAVGSFAPSPAVGVSVGADGSLILGGLSPQIATGLEVVVDVRPESGGLVVQALFFRLMNGQQYFFNRERIQNALVDLGTDGVFLPAEFDPSSGKVKIRDLDFDQVKPAAVLADEITSLANQPRRNRITGRRERTSWTFELVLVFTQAVSVEVFEREVSENVPTLPRDKSKGLQQVRLNWLDTRYEHPPLQQSSSGTKAVLTFEAELAPV